MRYKISNKYGEVCLDEEDDSFINYTGWVKYETFLKELLLTDKNLALKLKNKYIEEQQQINPYIRGYIPEIDDKNGIRGSYEEWLKIRQKLTT